MRNWIPATHYVKRAKHGDLLLTEAVGEWPGGPSRVVEIAPDPAAPEILFNVVHQYPWHAAEFGPMGVFDCEFVLVPDCEYASEEAPAAKEESQCQQQCLFTIGALASASAPSAKAV